jgi:exodeoxyribonuclease VII large subunit
VHDFLRISRERWPLADVLVIPASVQGDGAAAQVAAGISRANSLRKPPHVIVIARGGGSVEDLWCFNEELLVRAIVASRVPVVSAVGHETDVTLADLAADLRAPTPSAAAELVLPDASEIRTQLEHIESRLQKSLRARAASARQRVEAIARHRGFRRPFDWLRALAQRLDECEQRSRVAIARRLNSHREKLASLAAQLESLSPLAVLARGYSLTKRISDGQTLREAGEASVGDEIETQLAQGSLVSRVTTILGEGSTGELDK